MKLIVQSATSTLICNMSTTEPSARLLLRQMAIHSTLTATMLTPVATILVTTSACPLLTVMMLSLETEPMSGTFTERLNQPEQMSTLDVLLMILTAIWVPCWVVRTMLPQTLLNFVVRVATNGTWRCSTEVNASVLIPTAMETSMCRLVMMSATDKWSHVLPAPSIAVELGARPFMKSTALHPFR